MMISCIEGNKSIQSSLCENIQHKSTSSLNVIDGLVKFHLPHPDIIAARPLLYKRKWDQSGDANYAERYLKSQSLKGYKVISKAQRLQRTVMAAIIYK